MSNAPLIIAGAAVGAAALAGGAAWVAEISARIAEDARWDTLTERLYHRERAAHATQRIQDLLNFWEREGPFPVCVPPHGGDRFSQAEQWELYQRGVTNAATLEDTPHGPRDDAPGDPRSHGIDLTPYERSQWSGWKLAPRWNQDADPPEETARILRLFAAIGDVYAHFELEWGGTWRSFKDWPHGETPGWRTLPFALEATC